MTTLALSTDRPGDNADAVVKELARLDLEVRELNRQLDRVEAEMWRALNELAREGFEQ
jgi:hypothetical protein